jgi:hypothetical protein
MRSKAKLWCIALAPANGDLEFKAMLTQSDMMIRTGRIVNISLFGAQIIKPNDEEITPAHRELFLVIQRRGGRSELPGLEGAASAYRTHQEHLVN